jgi:hypothetical protein
LVTAYIDEVLQWGIEPIVYEPTPMPTPTPTIRPTEGPDKDIYTPYYNLAKEPLLENALTYGYINSDEDADYFVFTPSHTGLYRFEGVDGIKDSIGFITAFNPNDNILYNYSTYPSNGSSPWYVESYLYAGTKNYFHMSKYDKGEGNIPCQYSIKVTYLKPDLSIYSTEPNSDCVGNSTTYTVEVVNNGGDMIEGQSFVVTLLVEGTDIVLSTECSTLLAKNKTVTIEFPKQAGFDLSTLTKGQYIINVKVDDQNTIDESNETNNSVSKYFFIEDYGNTKESATEIKLGAKVSGKMDYSSDYDYFKFIPESDANYVMLSSDENIKFDLYDGNGKGLKYGYSLVPYKLIAGNTYYIRLYNKSGLITDYEFVLEKEDYGNEINFATPIKVEDKIIGKIDYKNDWDYFQYTPDSNGAYAIISSNENMRIDFFDSNGKRLKYGHSPVPYEMIAGNTYYIGLGSKDGLITDYEFVLEKEDYGNEINFATPIKVEDKIIGKIDYKYDGDYFKFVPDSNETYIGTVNSDETVWIFLYDSKGERLKYSSNGYLNYDFITDNTYYISLSYNNSATGYDFVITKDDFGNDINSSTSVKAGKTNGKIDYYKDYDYFEFTPDSDSKYIAMLTGAEDNRLRINLYDSEGNFVETSSSSKMMCDLEAGNKYFIAVYDNYYPRGNYELSIFKEEDGDSIDNAVAITEASEMSAKIYGEDDIDYFSYIPKKSGFYSIYTTGMDTVGVLYSDKKKVISENNDKGIDDKNFYIVANMEANKLYYIGVKGNKQIGDYVLKVEEIINKP